MRGGYYQVFDDMSRELDLMTTPGHKNVLMVHGMYARGALGPRRAGPSTSASALACVGVRSTEQKNPALLLLVMDLWDRSARSLLDDNILSLKVES